MTRKTFLLRQSVIFGLLLMIANLPVLGDTRVVMIPNKGRLFVLSIGINKYKATEYQLKYARQDAEAMVRELELRGGQEIYREIKFPKSVADRQEKSLTDEQATRANILAVLEELESQTASNDTLIVSFSGNGASFGSTHRGGSLVAEEKQQFYLYPYDADPANIGETGISSELLQVYLQRIRAKNKMFIFDSCHSGFGYDSIAETFTRQDQSTRTENTLFIGVDTQSFDDDIRRQGTLTAVVFDGLSGKADFDGNGKVTAREIEAYVYQGIIPFSVRYQGDGGIHPRTIFSGRDFNVALTDWQLAKIKYSKLDEAALIAEQRRLQEKRAETQKSTAESARLQQAKKAKEDEILEIKKQKYVEKDADRKSLDEKLAAALNELNKIDEEIKRLLPAAIESDRIELEKIEIAAKVVTDLLVSQQKPGENRAQVTRPSVKKEDAPRQGQDYALFFANDQFSNWSNLKNPYNDVVDIAAELQKNYGFGKENIAVLRNLTKAQMQQVIDRYKGEDGVESEVYYSAEDKYGEGNFRKVRFGPDDQLFIFFAGHGHAFEVGRDSKNQPKLNGLLVSADSPKFSKEEKDKFVRLDDLLVDIDSIPNRHIMLVFDACFAGQIWRPSRLHPYAEIKGSGANRPEEKSSDRIVPAVYRAGETSSIFSSASFGLTTAQQVTRDRYIRRNMGSRSRVVFTSGSEPVPDGYCEEYRNGDRSDVCVKRSRNSPFAAGLLEALRTNGRRHKVLLGYEIIPFVNDLDEQNVEKGKLDDTSDGDFVFVSPLKQ